MCQLDVALKDLRWRKLTPTVRPTKICTLFSEPQHTSRVYMLQMLLITAQLQFLVCKSGMHNAPK